MATTRAQHGVSPPQQQAGGKEKTPAGPTCNSPPMLTVPRKTAISEPHSGDDGPNFNASIEEQTHVSDGIWWGSGFASAEPNSTALRQGESQLRIMFLSLPNSKAAVCTRVDPSIDDADVSPIAQRADWDGGKSSKSGNGGGDDDSSAASPRVAATVGSVGVVGLVAAVFGLL